MTCIPVVTRKIFPAELTFQYTFVIDNSLSSIVVETLEPTQTKYSPKTLTTDYTIDTAAKIVTFVSETTRGPVGTLVKIRRCTERKRGISWNSEAAFSPSTANRDQQQDFAFQQELETELSDVLHRNDRRDEWNAEGLEGCNALPGTRGNCWVTLDQLNAAIFDGIVIDLSQPLVIVLTGDGSTTNFTLPGARQTTAQQWFVFKNGVHQNSDDSTGGIGVYTIVVMPGQDDQIVFEDAPEVGTSILCTLLKGTVVSQFADDSITSDMIQDGAVGLRHINIGAGDALRFLICDALGDPVGRVALHTDINDFDSGVRENRLDQMAVPTTAVAMNSQKITGLANGSAAQDAVAINQLPSSPARIDSTNIPNPGLGAFTDAVITGFKVKHIVYTFRYRTNRHATFVVQLEDEFTQRTMEVMVTDSGGAVDYVRATFKRNSGQTGWQVSFSESRWNGVTGLHSGPFGVGAVTYGDA
jgi:hypothetical protein